MKFIMSEVMRMLIEIHTIHAVRETCTAITMKSSVRAVIGFSTEES